MFLLLSFENIFFHSMGCLTTYQMLCTELSQDLAPPERNVYDLILSVAKNLGGVSYIFLWQSLS